jgi:hypothetical protein
MDTEQLTKLLGESVANEHAVYGALHQAQARAKTLEAEVARLNQRAREDVFLIMELSDAISWRLPAWPKTLKERVDARLADGIEGTQQVPKEE